MAQKRMFDKTITNSDTFLELPDSSQVLYFHLSMNADDDGFINNWKSILRMTGTKEDDLKILISKQFVIPFESGVIVIKHWRINNYLRNDRHKETTFREEFAQLSINDNEEYVVNTDSGIQTVYLDKNSIDKNSIEKSNNIICSQPPKIGKTLSVYEQEFEEAWKLFPKKTGKKDALKHYINARKKETTFEQVIEGIKKYNVYIDVNKIPYQYIKGGSSWFCEEKWNDEIKIEQHPKKETSEERVARITRELEEMHKKEEEMKNERE